MIGYRKKIQDEVYKACRVYLRSVAHSKDDKTYDLIMKFPCVNGEAKAKLIMRIKYCDVCGRNLSRSQGFEGPSSLDTCQSSASTLQCPESFFTQETGSSSLTNEANSLTLDELDLSSERSFDPGKRQYMCSLNEYAQRNHLSELHWKTQQVGGLYRAYLHFLGKDFFSSRGHATKMNAKEDCAKEVWRYLRLSNMLSAAPQSLPKNPGPESIKALNELCLKHGLQWTVVFPEIGQQQFFCSVTVEKDKGKIGEFDSGPVPRRTKKWAKEQACKTALEFVSKQARLLIPS